MDFVQIAQRHGGPVDSQDRRLWDLFVATATSHPDHDAVVSLWQTDSKDGQQCGDHKPTQGDPTVKRWTYDELLHRAEALAAGLRARGYAAGMPLVAFLGNSAEWALLFWTAAKLQMPFVPLDPRGLEDPSEVSKILGLVKPGVVVVSNTTAARVLPKTTSVWKTCIRIQIEPQASPPEPMEDGWDSLSNVALAHPAGPKEVASSRPSTELNDVALVVFTSGTTATPKGCLHTSANLLSQIVDFDPQGDVVDRWLVHTPVSHIFAINNALRAWSRGDAVVFPSEYFDVQATIRALVSERCTFMSAVPTMVKALLAQPSFPGKDAIHLTYMTLGGTNISAADIKLCQDQLGAKTAIQSFGMSEGVPVTSWHRQDPLLTDGYHPGVGKVLPGASIRVCATESKTPLAVNEVGELHIGGTSVIRGYLGGIASESFYTDDAGHWLVTGDQAVIDENGVLHILGRYKDLIIRAGENIAPLKIEGALTSIQGVTAQVVGIPDEMAGELPVAIVRMPTKTQILEAASSLGAKYSLDGVYTLEDLGLDHFPITRTGKIRKEELKAAVLRQKHKPEASLVPTQNTAAPPAAADALAIPPESPPQSPSPSPSQTSSESFDEDTPGATSHRAHPPQSLSKSSLGASPPTETSHLLTKLSSIVSDIVGLVPSPGADLREIMDSVSMLRYTDRVLRRLGQKLYLEDILSHPALADQAALLVSRGNRRAMPLADTASRQHPINETRGLHTPTASRTTADDDAEPLELSNPLASTSPALQTAASSLLKQLRLSPLDVEGVYPIRANYHRFISNQRPQTYRHRMCFSIRGITLPKIRQALEAALATRALLRTLLVRVPAEHTSYHVALHTHAILPHMIAAIDVPDAAGLEALRQDDTAAAFHPHLAVQAQLVTVQVNNNNEAHLLLTYSHTVFDLLSIQPFHRDLDILLSTPEPSTAALPLSTPFRLFSDLYHNNTHSTPAKASVQATAHRLRGISKFPAALWPQQRAPGWMIGNDADADDAPRRALLRERLWAAAPAPAAPPAAAGEAVTPRELRFPRVSRVVHLPHMPKLQTQRSLHPQTVAVAALAILNVLQTGQDYAVFNTIDAGRTWPFVPASLEALLPSAMSLDGPTVEWLLHMLRVALHDDERVESVGQFLGRVQRELQEAAQHAHAPWDQVLEALGPEEGRVAADAVCRQTFVWDVSLTMTRRRNDYTSMAFEARYDWADCGLYWNCCMIDRDSLMFFASWDTAQMTDREVQRRCDEYADVLRRITDVGNWDRGLAEIML